jgi:predicted unusual protein kinase regulating ubiquinone biosynthesis (AarF/ABC1/UbiB family)
VNECKPLIVDEFGEKLLEELDYVQEGRNIRQGPTLIPEP